MKLHKVAFWLLVIGGLAWGLEVIGYGLNNYLPAGLLTLVYALVGLSALYEAFGHRKLCRHCSEAM